MKVAIIHPSLKVKGGAENVVMWLADELSKRGHTVDIITAEYDEDFWGLKESKRFNIVNMPLGGYSWSPIVWLFSGWKLRNILTEYDLVNPHNFPAYIWVYWAKRFNNQIPKIIWFCEEPARYFYGDVLNKHTTKAKLVDASSATVSSSLYQRARRRTFKQWVIFSWLHTNSLYIRYVHAPFVKKLDLIVVPRIDVILTNSTYIASTVKEIFGVKAYPCLLGIPEDRFVVMPDIAYENFIFTPTRFFYEKNVFNSIRAVKILVDAGKFDGWRYVIAGSGPLLDKAKQFVTNQGLEDIILLKGFISEEELATFFAKTSLVMYLPLDETYGLVFPEAGFYKKAVIGPNHGGPTELIHDGVTGYQVDPLDPYSISSALESMITNRRRTINMGQKNEKFVRSELTFVKFTDRFLSLLERII